MLLSSLTLEEQERLAYIEGRTQIAATLASLIDALENDPDIRHDFYRYGYERGYHYGRADGKTKHCKWCSQNTTA